MRGWHFLVGVACWTLANPALAQRRGDGAAARRLELKVTSPLAFGDVTVPTGRYVVSVNETSIALTSSGSMTLFATLPVTKTQVEVAVSTPTVELVVKGAEATLVVKSLDQVWTSQKARVVTDAQAQTSLVALSQKNEAAVVGGIPEEKSAVALVDDALVRLLPELKPCADQAHKARWQTDDAKFIRCACPLVEKWRLPKVKAAVRVHRQIIVGKSGVSFTATPQGRAQECRVWTGLKAPEELATPVAAPAPVVPKAQ